MRWPLWFLLITASLLGGCGPTFEAIQINRPPHKLHARQPRSVRMFASPPARPHVDVAILQVAQLDLIDGDDRVGILREMRARAAEIGCDGVVLGQHGRRSGVDTTTPLYLVGGGSTNSWEGTCIVYDDRERPDEERVARRDRDDADP